MNTVIITDLTGTITKADAAKFLNVSARTLERRAYAGEVKRYKIKDSPYVRFSDKEIKSMNPKGKK